MIYVSVHEGSKKRHKSYWKSAFCIHFVIYVLGIIDAVYKDDISVYFSNIWGYTNYADYIIAIIYQRIIRILHYVNFFRMKVILHGISWLVCKLVSTYMCHYSHASFAYKCIQDRIPMNLEWILEDAYYQTNLPFKLVFGNFTVRGKIMSLSCNLKQK